MTTEFEQAAIELKEKTGSLVVQNDDDYKVAASILSEAKRREKEVKAFFKPLKQKAHEAHRAITQQEKTILDSISVITSDCNNKMIAYQSEQERIKREEAERKAEEIRKQQEEQKLKEAMEAEAAGEQKLADEIMNEPVIAPVVIAEPAAPKVEGVNIRTTWKAEVTDKTALLRFVADNLHMAHIFDVNESVINGLARSHGAALNIPGLRPVEHKSVISRSRKEVEFPF